MDFLTQVNRDVQQILSSDFATNITFTPPLGAPVTITGYTSKHYLEVDNKGFISVSGKKAYVDVSIKALEHAGYITRNSNGNLLSFEKHLVTFTDGTGHTRTYIIQTGDSAADENVGIIKFTLGFYNAGTPPARIIYGWMDVRIYVIIANPLPMPNPNQTLDNGDAIPLYYSLNSDRTLTIPYLIQYPNCGFLQPFILNNREAGNVVYNNTNATFSIPLPGGMNNGNNIEFNARVPIFNLP